VPVPLLIDLETAVGEIRQACEELGNEAHRSPFFFIVGAGLSSPPVPLAATIIEHCQSVATKYQRAKALENAATLDLYSHWFGLAYPGARQRQLYLRSLIEKKPLSLASLRLAHLLAAHKLTNLVVTTNFDDFIARALRLFGEEPALCDHPRTVGRIDRERPDVQVVHVHGSYLFYDLANLRGEVTGRAQPDEESSFTMAGLLDSLLWNRSPLVLGYSGWEGDIIMSALKRRLRGGNPLAQSIYWFCYRRANLAQMPAWLRESADVRFVVPAESSTETGGTVRSGAPEERTSPLAAEKTEPSLPAFAVFDQLNRAFEIGAPALFENPIGYFADNLAASLPDVEGGGDPYAFKALVERLRRVANAFAKTRAPRGLEADLDYLRELMRESHYGEAGELLAKIIPARLTKLDASDRKEVLAAAALAGTAIADKIDGGKLPTGSKHLPPFDARLNRILGELPEGMAWCVASRTGQFGFESFQHGKPYGAFTFHFADALRDRGADVDGDGRVSILEAVLATAPRIATEGNRQTPIVAGDADRIALFAAGSPTAGSRTKAVLHALLIGVAKYKHAGMDLRGPPNDVALMEKLLANKKGRLFARVTVQSLIDSEATRAAVAKALAKLAAATKPGDLAMVYFSGHALREEEVQKAETLTLVLNDYTPAGRGRMNHRELIAALAQGKAAQQLVVLDF